MMPYFILKQKLSNKLNSYDIKFIQHEESYTSICSFVDEEEMKHQENYLGSRIKRGLFKTKSGKLINADINGSANIARKVIGDVIYDRPIVDLMFNPIKINFL
jgi:transposase